MAFPGNGHYEPGEDRCITGYPVIVVVVMVVKEMQAASVKAVGKALIRWLKPVSIFEGPN